MQVKQVIPNSRILEISDVGTFRVGLSLESGQAFRWQKRYYGGTLNYIGEIEGHELTISQKENGTIIAGCSVEEWESIWADYFDLNRDYDELFEPAKLDPFALDCITVSTGLHLLKQPPWETCIGFLISQNNRVTRISTTMLELSKRYGKHLLNCWRFPEPTTLAALSEEDWLSLGVGYRARALQEFSEFVAAYPDALQEWAQLETPKLIERLMMFYGIGKKVASCIALFGYERLEVFPIDTWIQKILDRFYGPGFKPESLGPYAGILQEYMYNYVRNNPAILD